MMKTVKALAVTALGIALALGPTVAATAAPATPDAATTASASPRAVYLGGVNLWEFCRKLGHRDVTNNSPHNVYSWYCLRNDDTLEDINMYAACQWQYNKQWAKPAFWDEADEYSWYCFLD